MEAKGRGQQIDREANVRKRVQPNTERKKTSKKENKHKTHGIYIPFAPFVFIPKLFMNMFFDLCSIPLSLCICVCVHVV